MQVSLMGGLFFNLNIQQLLTQQISQILQFCTGRRDIFVVYIFSRKIYDLRLCNVYHSILLCINTRRKKICYDNMTNVPFYGISHLFSKTVMVILHADQQFSSRVSVMNACHGTNSLDCLQPSQLQDFKGYFFMKIEA